MKYTDVTRATYTNLDVLQEKRIDDCCNVDANRSLSDSWKVFTKFALLKEKPPKGYMSSGWRLTKNQATTRLENVWLEVWTKIGTSRSEERKRQEWANEKPKLDNAQRLRGIYFIDPEDGEYKEIIKNARRKLEVPVDAGNALQERNKETLQLSGNWSGELWIRQDSKNKACMYRGGSWVHETTFGIISTERSWRSHRRQRIQFDDTLQLGSQVYSDASSDENSRCEGSSGQGMEEARNKTSLAVGQSEEQKKLFWKHKDTNKVHFAALMDICHHKHTELEPKFQKDKVVESHSEVTS